MSNTHTDLLDTAYLQFSFSVKLFDYLDRKAPFDKDQFDVSLINLEKGNILNLPHNQFNKYADIVDAAANAISISFGAAANTLYEAIKEKRKDSLYNKRLETEADKIECIVYMIRCCFAQGLATPTWKINQAFHEVKYNLNNKEIDLSALDGKIFEAQDIGGYESLFILKDKAKRLGMLN